MISADRLSQLLLRHWDVLGDGRPAPARFSYLLNTKGSEPTSKLVLLAFAPGECAPRLAVKLARSKDQNANLEAEYDNLRTVEPFAKRGRVVTPRALLCEAEDGWVWLAESVVDGTELSPDAFSAPGAVVDPVVDWLVHLGRSTLAVRTTATAAEEIPELLARAGGYVTTAHEHGVLARAAGPLHRLDGQPLPRVLEQRDMGVWNLLLARDGTIGVVDWESSRSGGFPAWDLFYFLAHCGFMVHRSTNSEERMNSFESTFWGGRGFASTARAALRRYLLGLGLREEWLGALAAACWLHHSLSEVTRLGIRPSQSLFWGMLISTLDRDCRVRCTA